MAFFFVWVVVGTVVNVLAVWQVLVLGSDVPDVFSQNHSENENIQLNKK